MILLAGAFGTFMLFVLAGLLALVVTAVLDRAVGKEIALLLWAVAIVVFTFLLGPSAPPPSNAHPSTVAVKGGTDIGSQRTTFAVLPTSQQPFVPPTEDARNPFLKHSDTRPLDPITLEAPPWTDLEFPNPPTVPGPAPEARRRLRGEAPTMAKGDGSSIPAVPPAAFQEYAKKADDVYDWAIKGGVKTHVYILAIADQDGGPLYEEGKPGFEERKWRLVGKGVDYDRMRVKYALVVGADKKLDPKDVLVAKRTNVPDPAAATQFDSWNLRRSVANLYVEALARNGLKPETLVSAPDIDALQRAAKEMEEVGATGKESGEGWRRAADLFQIAEEKARANAAPGVRAEILVGLVRAYRALNDEQGLFRVLAEYARVSPERADPWIWLGVTHLEALQLAPEAGDYFRAALERSGANEAARLGEGDALTFLGRHRDALAAYGRVTTGSYDATVRRAEAQLRLGDLDAALRTAEDAARLKPDAVRAVLVRGAVLYAKAQNAKELEPARDTFARASTMDTADALEFRAQALYDLGLTCWRMGQSDAAMQAFDACEAALKGGSRPGRFGDETVSPAFGRALVAYSLGSDAELKQGMETARTQAPRASYLEAFAGVVAAKAGDDHEAVRDFEKALRLSGAYPELDGWLAWTQSRLARKLADSGAAATEARAGFEASTAFGERATESEERADAKGFRSHLRQAWVWIQAEHVTPQRLRFEKAKLVVQRVLDRVDREQPAALAIRGYANFRLADYDQSIRDFDDVLRIVPAGEGPWAAWRKYAEDTQAAIKKWRSLEEKTVVFDDAQLPREWELDESKGVRIHTEPEIARLVIDGTATKDGSPAEPTVTVRNSTLFAIDSFEEMTIPIKIPTRDEKGNAINNVTFCVEVRKSVRAAGAQQKTPGVAVCYDKGKIAVRVGSGQKEEWRDGEIHRLVPETAWPSNDLIEVRVVREDRKDGIMAVYLNGVLVLRDKVSGFRDTKAAADLWIGGFGNQAQPFQVEIGRVRVIRVRKS